MNEVQDLPVALVQADSRGRVPLKKYTTAEPLEGWRVYRSPDGRTIRLEAVPL